MKSNIGNISEKICEFFEVSLQGKLPLSDCKVLFVIAHNLISFSSVDVLDVYVDKKDRVWVLDVNPFGDPTSPLLFDWEELTNSSNLIIKIVESDEEKMTSTLGSSRGPVDVHLAPDFSNFLAICKQQAIDVQSDDSHSDTEA